MAWQMSATPPPKCQGRMNHLGDSISALRKQQVGDTQGQLLNVFDMLEAPKWWDVQGKQQASMQASLDLDAMEVRELSGETEPLASLENQMAQQFEKLQACFVNAFKEVVALCSHAARQCDVISAQLERLEAKVDTKATNEVYMDTRSAGVSAAVDTTADWGKTIEGLPDSVDQRQLFAKHNTVGRSNRWSSEECSLDAALASSNISHASRESDPPLEIAIPEAPTPRAQARLSVSLGVASRGLKGGIQSKRRLTRKGVMLKPQIRASGESHLSRQPVSLYMAILSAFPLMPDSVLVTSCDLMACVFLFFDSIMIPYHWAWNPPETSVIFLIISCAAAIFWTLDMLLHFAVCTVARGKLISAPSEIVWYNLKHQFMLDLPLVFIEWTGVMVETIQSTRNRRQHAPITLSVLKILRIARVIRALRVFKLLCSGRLANLKGFIMAKAEKLGIVAMVRVLVQIGELMCAIVWICHVGACTWVALQARGWKDTKLSWEVNIAKQYDESANTFAEADLSDGFVYGLAFYWALTNMFSGASVLIPQTTMEIVYATTFTFFGLLVASAMISSMAAILVTTAEGQRQLTHRKNQLREFLRQRQVDRTLSLLIQHQVTQRARGERRLAQTDIAMLSFLSAELKGELQCGLSSHMFRARPLWRACYFVDDQVIQNLCKLAVSTETYTPGQIVFDVGRAVDQAYTICWGTMQYTQHVRVGLDSPNLPFTPTSLEQSLPRSESSSCLESSSLPVKKGDNFCDLALWAQWETVGLMEAASHCEVVICSFQGLTDVLAASNCAAEIFICGYADALLRFIDTENPTCLSDLSSTVDYDSVVAFMYGEERLQMSMPGLTMFYQENTLLPGLGDALEEELRDGKCHLSIDNSERVLRVVRIGALYLRRSDERVCVNIGKIIHYRPVVRVDLPGKKLRMQETLEACVERVVDQLFQLCKTSITIDDATIDREPCTSVQRKSTQFGLPTNYVRYTCLATLASCAELEIKLLEWSGGPAVECFALPHGEDGSTKNVFAWMTHGEYESMTNSQKNSDIDQLVTRWLDNFMA